MMYLLFIYFFSPTLKKTDIITSIITILSSYCVDAAGIEAYTTWHHRDFEIIRSIITGRGANRLWLLHHQATLDPSDQAKSLKDHLLVAVVRSLRHRWLGAQRMHDPHHGLWFFFSAPLQEGGVLLAPPILCQSWQPFLRRGWAPQLFNQCAFRILEVLLTSNF